MIPYGRQDITEEDIQSVIDVLKSDFLTQGPQIELFEQKFAQYCGSQYAVAVASCTAALHLACMALELKEGDIFWTTPNTFVASANCGLYCGASVDFVDIDPDTWNMSITKLEEKLVQAEKEGKLPKLVIPVHFSGRSCDMKAIKKLAVHYNFKIIEDAAHCIGASYDNKKVGSCDYSDIAVFSTHPVKIITTGEGGNITTNNADIYEQLLKLRTHGITKSPEQMIREPIGPWYFEQQHLGYHYRMTDMQAALGISQMDRLDTYVAQRIQIAKRYSEKLSHLPLQLPAAEGFDDSSWHLYVVRLNLSEINVTHPQVFNSMREKGIGVNLHYIPVHTHPYFEQLGFGFGDFPEAEQYYSEALTLPLYPKLTEDEQDYICKTLEEILS